MTSGNPHDLYVRRIFSGKEESIAFLEFTLPKDVCSILDLSNLEFVKENFIGEKQKESRTDILYQIPLKSGSEIFVYLLFEHKSYYDPNIYTQLLKYLSSIYEWQMKNLGHYYPVLPFVFYHGERGWDLASNFLDAFHLTKETKILSRYIPSFSFLLYKLNSVIDEFPKNLLSLRLYFRILRSIRKEHYLFMEALRKTMRELSEEKTQWKKLEIMRTILEYIDRARKDSEKFYDIEIYEDVEEELMIYLEKIKQEGVEKGKLEGEKQGIAKGKLEKEIEDARLMKEEGIALAVIQRVTGLTEEQLRENDIIG
ncbi:MAG: Rpn family recombination-promoting nuclease/putative transposase [Leptospira sp.]|nr:Rpn family recombination-promoting nuclease/putative transposase [Leptospira sp.]